QVWTHIRSVCVERCSDGAVVDSTTPRLSWKVDTDEIDWRQVSASIRLDGTETVTLDSGESVFVSWPFSPLGPHERHSLEVCVTGADGVTTEWSKPLCLRSGCLAEGEWSAEVVGVGGRPGEACPGMVRKEVVGDCAIAPATVAATRA